MTEPAPDSLAQTLSRGAARLEAAGVEGPRRDARLLLAAALGGGSEQLVARPERRLAAEELRSFERLVERRAGREPVSRILGAREFWSLTLRITPEVFDPRPESETLVEAVLERAGQRDAALRVLDLGSGSGCLLLALLSELPQARGLGVDASARAVAVARQNARALGLAGRARFRQGDWADRVNGLWQCIVSNPPYIKEGEIETLAPEVACYDPHLALAGGNDGLTAYRRLVPQTKRLLAPGGTVAVELGAGQAEAVASLFESVGLVVVDSKPDLAGIERCVVAVRPPDEAGPAT